MIKRILAGLFLLMPTIFLAVDNIDWNQRLLDSAKNGDLIEVENALKNGADIETKDNIGFTALHRASYRGHENIANLLLENGANIESKSHCNCTALYEASQNGKENIVKLLLRNRANINAKDNCGLTALNVACIGNFENIIKILLENGIKINYKMICCRNEDILKLIRLLYRLNKIPYISMFKKAKFKEILSEIDKINGTKTALGFILNTDLFDRSPDKIKKLVIFYEKLNSLQFPDKFDTNLENINKEFKNIINDKHNNIGKTIKIFGLKNYYKEILPKVLAGYRLKEFHNLPSELVYKITQKFW